MRQVLGEIAELNSLLHNYKRPPDELQELQNRRLRALIHHAYERVPYYRTLFHSVGITPADIQTASDLPKIPITTKQTLLSMPIENVIAQGTNISSCLPFPTSGTTGEPLKIYLTRSEFQTRRLIDFRALMIVGFRPSDRLAIMGPRKERSTRWYERFGLFRTMVITGDLPTRVQIERLREFRPTVLWAYAHGLEAMVHEMRGMLRSLIRPRVIVTSATQRSDRLSKQLAADLDAEMFQFYGAIESGRIAHECPAHRGMHVNADRLILECIESETSSNTNDMGNVVVTPLGSFAMPFIRYRLGDLVASTNERCTCGSSFPLIDSLVGREFDLFVLPSGRRIGISWLNFLLIRIEGVDQYRVIQQRKDHVVVQLSSRSELAPKLLDDLKRQIAERFQEPIQIDIQRFNFVPEPGRKFRMFESKVEAGEYTLDSVG